MTLNNGADRASAKPGAFWVRLVHPHFAIPVAVFVSAVVFFWSLGEAAYWDRDEPRNAGCAAEMMARGNWIVPTFNDELRQQKPVLLYWLMGIAYSVFGQNEFAGRFFSALFAVGTVVATWGMSRRFFGNAVALLASLILCTNIMFGVAARAATPDSLLIFCVVMALFCFVSKCSFQSNPFDNRFGFWGTYGFLGLAMLSKGPVGFVLPMAVMGWFLLQQDWLRTNGDGRTGNAAFCRRLIEPFHPSRFVRVLFSMRPLAGACFSLAIAAPWFVAVGFATEGEFLQRFFLDENFGRATQVLENHSGGLWFYPIAILAGFFPWSMFWGPVAIDLLLRSKKSIASQREDSQSEGVRFALCWIVIQVVAFSCIQTKLPSYVTPCYPALSMLTAFALVRAIQSASFTPNWVWKAANISLVLSGLGLVVGFGVASQRFEVIPVWLACFGLAPVGMGASGLIPVASVNFSKATRATAVAVAMAAVLCVGLLGVGAGSIGKSNRMELARYKSNEDMGDVATFGCLESSWVYYGERRLLELRTDGLEDPRAVAELADRKFWQRKPRLSPQQFAATNCEGLVITTEELLPSLKEKLPEDWGVVQAADWFLKDQSLVLVGRRPNLDSNGHSARLDRANEKARR